MTGYDDLTPIPPREQRQVFSSDGTQLNVEVYGPEGAPTIVLAHGWTCSIVFWVRQIRELSHDFRVVAYDQRGHGASGSPGPAGYSTNGLADDLSAVLDDVLAPGEQAVLAGHSMGSMTAIAFATRHPEQFRRQVVASVLTSTGMHELVIRSAVVPMPLALARVFEPISAAVMGISTGSRPNRLTRLVVKHASLSRSADRVETDFCARIVAACPSRTRSGFAKMLAGMDLDRDVARYGVPTIVVAGTRDRLTPIWHARRLAATLPQLVDSIEIEGCGHMTPVQAADQVTGAILQQARTHLTGPVRTGG